MRVMYVTPWVLGDAGANAADIFPRLAAASAEFSMVIVADFPRNRHHIRVRQGAEYLRLEPGRSWLRYAIRIARKARQQEIDVIHIFYRQQNAALLVLIRLALAALGARARLLLDHRSVNLAKGARRFRKLALNTMAQPFCHRLAGNPWAVETNHLFLMRAKSVVDLGYDVLPPRVDRADYSLGGAVNVWFIGSMKPKNRKSQFLIDIFAKLEGRLSDNPEGFDRPLRIHVAGPTKPDQAEKLRRNRLVTYHGQMPRAKLYEKLQQYPGIGLAYMNEEFHGFAPSLKFVEYAALRFKVLASATLGLRTQAERMNFPRVTFIKEDPIAWADAIIDAVSTLDRLQPPWQDAPLWSYEAIFERQVVPLYRELAPAPAASAQENRKSAFEKSDTAASKT